MTGIKSAPIARLIAVSLDPQAITSANSDELLTFLREQLDRFEQEEAAEVARAVLRGAPSDYIVQRAHDLARRTHQLRAQIFSVRVHINVLKASGG